MAEYKVWPGKPYPLGAAYDGTGTNFSVFSEVAEKVELCLFNDAGEETRMTLPETTAFCWHGYLPEVEPGQRYGFRIHGPWDPQRGHRCNPAKLLLDPYGKAIEGEVTWNEAVFPYYFNDPEGAPSTINSAPFVPKTVVINPFFDWERDHSPRIPLHETVIYEINVKGFTKRHSAIPPEIQGTYAGLSHPAMIEYFLGLGVTAVELLPVHQFIHDGHLVERGLRNYWGYNSIGYLAPHNEYSSRGQKGSQVQDFKLMVKSLHDAGIEVILDVVYNHTAEGNHLGPMLCFKGIDNAAYYRLVNDNQKYYMDYTGTGNSLNMRHPHVLQLIMDSLRYWILDMHVDGFRFDLAATLARELHDVDRLSAFFDLIQQDPVVSQVKLIAEPWDVGQGGYQVGNFPPLWAEWNGKYRDSIRDFWRDQGLSLGEVAYRFTGSSDLYEKTGRRPFASINFITAHDGFTLYDLVSYNEKHNEGNGEENRDGDNYNRSWNCGAEGASDSPGINHLRAMMKRNFLATLFLSQGVPMLLGGDEMGRTQQGNNNAYCQDNEISWFDWGAVDPDLLEFTQQLIKFRREHPVFRRPGWFQGRPILGSGVDDIGWFTPQGKEMTDGQWGEAVEKCIAIFLNGDAILTKDSRGERIKDDSFYLIINAYKDPVIFTLPEARWGKKWKKVFATTETRFPTNGESFRARRKITMKERSLMVLIRVE